MWKARLSRTRALRASAGLLAALLIAPRAAGAQVVIVTTSAAEPTLEDRTLRHFIAEGLLDLDVPVLRGMEQLEQGQVCLEYVVSVLEVEPKVYDGAVASSVLVKRSVGGLDRTRPRILHQFHEYRDLKEMAGVVVEGILTELGALEGEPAAP